MNTSREHYRGILKTTSLIGGSSLINILIGMVRTKFVAILLGPSGVGLMGVYASIIGIVSKASGMGISSSGVRQIAEASGKKDDIKMAQTVIALRRVCWVTGGVGMVIMVAGSWMWSTWSFGTYDYAVPIALLGSTILLDSIACGQSCILQGTRRIGDLAKVSVVGSVSGAVIGIPCFFLLGKKGIVPSFVLGSIVALMASWWFARRVSVKNVVVPWGMSKNMASELLSFGFPIMLSGLMSVSVSYFIRVVMVSEVGLEGVGIYQAAFALSGILVNFVLTAMGTDYYPRLTAVATDDTQTANEVNTQTEIALLLAVPALAATIIFAPVVITLFYSGKFDAAVPILRWSVYGILGRVISWPLGFVLLAKGRSKLFLFTETIANVFHLIMIIVCTRVWGLPGTGIAFTCLYIAYSLGIYAVVCYISKNPWTMRCFIRVTLFTSVLVLLGINCSIMSYTWLQWTLSILMFSGLSFYCLNRMLAQTGITLQMMIGKMKGA